MGKKLFMLVAGYIAGSLVTGLYADKKGGDVKKEAQKQQKQGGSALEYLATYLLDVQKKFFGDVSQKVVTEENKEILKNKIQEVTDIVDEYKIEAEKAITKLKKNSKNFAEDAYKHLEEFSKLKTEEGEARLKDLGKQVSTEFKKKFKLMVKQIKSNIK